MPTHDDNAPSMTIQEVCAKLRISRPTVDRLIAAGHIPVVHVSERRPRVTPADLNAYLEGRRAPRSTP